jgi:hypothetical protein
MRLWAFFAILLLGALIPPTAVSANPGRADLVSLTTEAPIIVRAEITKASRLSEKLSPGLAPGFRRFLISAQISNVLIAPGFVPRTIEYLVDIGTGPRGKTPKLKGLPVLLFLAPGNREAQFQLVRPWAQVDWNAERDAYVRAVAAEAVAAPQIRDMEISGLGQAFHVPGSLPGESESQIFIQTKAGDPMSLVILSRPGQAKAFSVATGDIIDDAAAGVKDGSLLWYQLACGLPRSLPAGSTSTLDPETAAAAKADYRFVLDSLGPCDRAYSQ